MVLRFDGAAEDGRAPTEEPSCNAVKELLSVFGGIHFYTQWFERLGASPATVLVAGLLALTFAFALRTLNARLSIEATEQSQ